MTDEILQWLEDNGYKLSDVMEDESGREFVIREYETDHSDEFSVYRKRIYLDELYA